MDGKDRIIAELRELVAKQTAHLGQQPKRISDLELQLAKAIKNSSNSPSSDIVKPPKISQSVGRKRNADSPLRNRSKDHARHAQ